MIVLRMEITALGDLAWRVSVGGEVSDITLAHVLQTAEAIRRAKLVGVRELVPAFTTVTVHMTPESAGDIVRAGLEAICATLADKLSTDLPAGADREIPVVYGGNEGPDLEAVAQHHAQTPGEIAAMHAAAGYRVHAIGFSPGFPYLAGLPLTLHTPRRATPRTRVPAGSVGIGGGQTGVYPMAGPGGWNLIGRTTRRMFDVNARPPAWLQVGDRVRFVDARNHPPSGDEQRSLLAQAASREPATPGHVVEVLDGGMACSVQDIGRWGWQAQGVSVGGATDGAALQVANLIVGNALGAAGLEWTMRGPRLLFHGETDVALTGAIVRGLTNGKRLRMQAGEVLDLSGARGGGCRGYVAFAGGLLVPEVLGSRSTDLRASFGGFDGRLLRAGDTLPLTSGPVGRHCSTGWRVTPSLACASDEADDSWDIRIMRGPDAAEFSDLAWKVFLGESFRVSSQSDRMGMRLDGARLPSGFAKEPISAGVAVGAVQVPPDGTPIILLADRQTLGGYPQIAYVIAADQSRLAQAVPGRSLSFRVVESDEAERARHAQLKDLRQLKLGLEHLRHRNA